MLSPILRAAAVIALVALLIVPAAIRSAAADVPLFPSDGRAKSLEDQAKGPIANPIEMGFTHEACASCVNGIAGYRKRFQQVFGPGGATIDNIAKAIATFERTVLSGNSAYDKFKTGDE